MLDPQRWSRHLLAAVLIAATPLAPGCFGDSATGRKGDAGDATPGSGGTAVCRVLGQVLTQSGEPLAAVQVSSGGATTATDSGGRFELDVPRAGTAVLLFEKSDYAPSYRSVTPAGAGLATVGAVMAAIDVAQTIDPTLPNTVQVAPGVAVHVPAGALVDPTGQAATGPVEFTVAWVPPSEAIEESPVPLVASDGTEEWPLITYGMVDVTARSGGVKLSVASGSSLELTIPAAAGDPESAGLFSVDPATGMWTLEGAAIHTGTTWTAQLPHLSWWNVDGFSKVPPDQRACVRFRARDAAGNAVPGVKVRGRWGPANNLTIGGTTDNQGELCHEKFPLGTTISIEWDVFLESGATKRVTGGFPLVPTVQGVKCNDPACQVANITVACTQDNQCGGGRDCVGGVCVAPGTVPPPIPDAGGGGSDVPCVPQCVAGQCSDDGCGQPCAECPGGQTCGPSGLCVDCVPQCVGKSCGSDGCNGSCGICDPGTSCSSSGQDCLDACALCPSGGCDTFGFEDGLQGWDTSGDVTTISQLGGTASPEGSRMLRLSTGLAYAAPSYAQKALCASADVQRITFQWRLYSEEFQEFCGSSFQDSFVVSFDIGGVRTALWTVTIDDLCAPGTSGCSGCGSQYTSLEPADVQFDQGDVFVTPWADADLALPAGAANGTVILEVQDVGDSAYDTVVLVDDIRLSAPTP